MWNIIKTLIAGIAVSAYFFPFEFTFLPGVNTKMAMAGVGVILYAMDLAKGRRGNFDKDGFVIAMIAAFVSLFGMLAVVWNSTNDYTYATYIVSMFVWLGGAYAAVKVVKWLHGYVSVELICNYLIAVCFGQCVLALLIDTIPAFKSFVDTYVVGFDFVNMKTLTKARRLYGIGAGLDVAGTRFAAVLVIIAVVIRRQSEYSSRNRILMYFASFIFIAVVGNMIARTTIVGIFVALAYWIVSSRNSGALINMKDVRIWKYLLISLGVALPIIMYTYSADEQFRANIQFAFEGFFSLAEKGYWETNSNNILKSMIIFPDNLKTWLIGDGYIENPSFRDPYYVGPTYGGYYKGTDIGYLRFIFYFGILGLATFIAFFIKVAKTCISRFPKYAVMFWLVLAINMIVWLKVSTDIFLVFAIFLCVSREDNDAYENSISDTLDI